MECDGELVGVSRGRVCRWARFSKLGNVHGSHRVCPPTKVNTREGDRLNPCLGQLSLSQRRSSRSHKLGIGSSRVSYFKFRARCLKISPKILKVYYSELSVEEAQLPESHQKVRTSLRLKICSPPHGILAAPHPTVSDADRGVAYLPSLPVHTVPHRDQSRNHVQPRQQGHPAIPCTRRSQLQTPRAPTRAGNTIRKRYSTRVGLPFLLSHSRRPLAHPGAQPNP